MVQLTKMQQRIYDYIAQTIRTQGYPPSVREIGDAVGLKSPSTVHFHLKHMEELGVIGKGAGKGRALTLTEPLPEENQIPIVGTVAAGTPILAEENIKEYIGVPAAWRADFALECHGDSMAPRICDGDIVCIRRQPEVESGQIAAVRIGDEATLKHFYRSGDVVQLIAENPAVCPPMVYAGTQLEEMAVEGMAVGICRSLV